MVPRLRTMLACELVAAVRGLRQRAVTPSGPRLRALYGQCLQTLAAADEDHPLDIDIAAAEQVIADLVDAWVPAGLARTRFRVSGGPGGSCCPGPCCAG